MFSGVFFASDSASIGVMGLFFIPVVRTIVFFISHGFFSIHKGPEEDAEPILCGIQKASKYKGFCEQPMSSRRRVRFPANVAP